MNIIKSLRWVLGIFVTVLAFFLLPLQVNAQVEGELGSISGSITWGDISYPGTVRISIAGNTTGFTTTASAANFDTGFILPPDTYTVTAILRPGGNNVDAYSTNLGTQTVSVAAGQSVTGINFDSFNQIGLVKGGLKINGANAPGYVQFCGPQTTDPCPNGMFDPNGPWFSISQDGQFTADIRPGDYRAHVVTSDLINVGIVPVTVNTGEILEDSSLQFSLNLGSLSGSVRWGTEVPSGVFVEILGNSGFTKSLSSADFDTGNVLPPDTYSVSASIRPAGDPQFYVPLGSQTITVAAGQSVTGINFDAFSVAGMVRGGLKVNGVDAPGYIQFCGPQAIDPCPNGMYSPNGPWFDIDQNGQFTGFILPGQYRAHVLTRDLTHVGIVPVTVTAGQILADSSLQFSLNLASISGSVTWGDISYPGNLQITITGNATGFNTTSSSVSFDTGFILPPDTYTVTAIARPGGNDLVDTVLGTQTVTVNEGQARTGVNFDAFSLIGLVKGNLTINGMDAPGYVQFCGPLETDPCPNGMYNPNGPWFDIGQGGQFTADIRPGDYRVHVVTRELVNIGIFPVTVSAGQVLDLSSTVVDVPTGQNVSVSLAGASVTFSQVTTSGFMTVTTSTHPQGGQPPSQYRFLGTYYDLITTAEYTGPVTVSITYNDADVHGQESNLKLFHWNGTSWQNITVSVDTVNNVITGSTPTLSPFAIGEPLNSSPIVDADGPYLVNEGGSVLVAATGDDPENGSLTYAWDLDNNGSFETPGQVVTFSAAGLDGPTSKTIAVQVTDNGDLTATAQATVNVANVLPVVGAISGPTAPVQVNTSVNTSVSFTDNGISDAHTAVWDWGDGTSSGVVTEANGSGIVAGTHTYTSAGVYAVNVTVTDDDGGAGQPSNPFQYVVIYDPNGGYVTGAGTITSTAGAYSPNPSLTGLAHFGFNSKYEHGANVPTGNTKFRFQVANLKFESTGYDWLVVGGAKAQYKGVGTINGLGNYGFLLSAIDGQINGGGGTDKFRIKIWDKNNNDAIIYDNQMGASDNSDPTTIVNAGGSIVIHH